MLYVVRDGKLVEAQKTKANSAPIIIPDLPAYQSPIDGRQVDGRRARRNDLARNGCRPYEGREQEMKEAARIANYADEINDKNIDEAVRRSYYRIAPEIRAELEGRK